MVEARLLLRQDTAIKWDKTSLKDHTRQNPRTGTRCSEATGQSESIRHIQELILSCCSALMEVHSGNMVGIVHVMSAFKCMFFPHGRCVCVTPGQGGCCFGTLQCAMSICQCSLSLFLQNGLRHHHLQACHCLWDSHGYGTDKRCWEAQEAENKSLPPAI